MRILLINIALRPPPSRVYPPIGLGYIASAMKRAGFSFDLLDLDIQPKAPEEVENFLRTNRYDVVAMGCIVTGYKFVKWLSRIVKENYPESTIVVGNSVASSIPVLLLQKTGVDIAVLGEGDETIVELLKTIEDKRELGGVRGIAYKIDGEVKITPHRPIIPDINVIPIPDWDLFDIEAYIENQSKALDEPLPPIPRDQLRSFVINTARGCLHNCTFCYHVFQGEKYRWRSVESIIGELEYHNNRYDINHFYFHDELSFFSVKQAEEFANAMLAKRLKIYWAASCRSGLFTKEEHLEVAKKLKEVGGLALSFSLESTSPEILQRMHKNVGPLEFSQQVKICKRAGLAVHTSLVIGYPEETPETIKATIDCCIDNGVYPSIGYLLPQPGTPMYDYARQHKYIQDEEEYLLSMGDRQDLHVNMTKIPDQELEAIVKDEMARANRALGMDLQPDSLIKTSFYRTKSKPEE
ncbi:MAG: radical SAM protein [Desulfobaccales bacterium]